MINLFRDKAIKKDVAKVFIDSFRNRYDMNAADTLTEKYITKMKKNQKE